MSGFLGEGYLWVKALHVIAVIAWMAAMLYLPRLFVYHCGAEVGSVQSETFKVMERRLLRAIMNPAMVASWLLGLGLAVHLDAWGEAWFQAKVALLIGMQVAHVFFARWRREFEADENRRDARFFRIMNEVPTLFLLGIVVLAVVKPI